MKIKISIYISLFLSIFMIYTVKADDSIVRVGLEKYFNGVSVISVNNNDLNVIVNNKSYDVTGEYTIKAISKDYYSVIDTFDTYNEAKKSLTQYTGYNCIPALTDNGWTIYIAADKKPLVEVNNIKTGNHAIVFAQNNVNEFIIDSQNPAQISSDSGIVDLGKCKYRDNIELYVKGSSITAINVIDIEHYLYGVINSEMPSSWPLEAQKAQAVAARTYVVATGNKHGIYDLCDNTNCQDYNGTAKESQNGIKAVDETAGKEIYYNDIPISAVYFSSDGGATHNSENVWLSEVPYLRGKIDEYEKEYREWERTFTYSELTNICNSKGYNIGSVNNVTAEYDNNGLCLGLTFVGSKGSKTVTKEEIRTVFSTSDEGSLLSRNFIIDNGSFTSLPQTVYVLGSNGKSTAVIDNTVAKNSMGESTQVKDNLFVYSSTGKTTISSQDEPKSSSDTKITLKGKGYGHGVGMSQYGAKGMAEAGLDYLEILNYYYTNVDIK